MPASPDFADRCIRLVAALGIARRGAVVAVEPLGGGTSSDIARVGLGGGPGRSICVKFARDRLAPPAGWCAPVRRNATEYAWLLFAERAVPGVVPAPLGRSVEMGGFATAYLGGPETRCWREELLAGRVDPAGGRAVGAVLARLHAASRGIDRAPFAGRADFRIMRLGPYFGALAAAYPGLAGALAAMAEALDRAADVCIHGDFAPKNILFRGARPVVVDAECASLGDPCFDLAFCLSHLCLKAVHLPGKCGALCATGRGVLDGYRGAGGGTGDPGLEARTARLLPMLMLARIDGQSPVAYLDASARERLRAGAVAMIERPPATLSEVLARLPVGAS